MFKNKKFRYIIIGVVALIVFLLIAKKAGWIGSEDLTEVATDKVQYRAIIESITANGKIQPQTEVKISPDVSGEIVELAVEEGQEVEKGQLLLKIKEDLYLSYLDRATAALNSSKSNLANSKSRLLQSEAQYTQQQLAWERNQTLYTKKTISEADYENAEAAWEIAKADLAAAKESVNSAKFAVSSSEASLKEARENLQKTIIYSPISGTISKLNVEKGERVVGTAQFAGTELLRIANLNLMEVKVEVNENDIVRVGHNDTALIEIDAYLEEKFKGIVTEIANSANTIGASTDQVTNFDIKIIILNESYQHLISEDNPHPFRPGMSATVEILTHYEDSILTVPIQAVTARADTAKLKALSPEEKKKTEKKELKEVVFVYGDGKVKQQEVTTGIQDNTYIQITTGLEEGDEVVTDPYSAINRVLKDGREVKKVDKEELYKVD
ncbi:MAG: efflux RND transporter periplasmic adaptor subunit [Bacteroidales bacterium]|nr:efflux RND transporter periplasmic adaptor subunit [Bacteroidales bacterium]MCF8455142.1 efflux RND transporter periplasmic adaptor subunit [Bacteroidales bacterium]